jgi:hypothetical protein
MDDGEAFMEKIYSPSMTSSQKMIAHRTKDFEKVQQKENRPRSAKTDLY